MFVTRGPLAPDSPLFVGREAELRQIAGWLAQVSCVGCVLGARQTGKTSLLLKLRERFAERFASVFVDLQGIEGASPEECFRAIATELVEQLGLDSFAGKPLPNGGVEFVAFLRQVAAQTSAIRIAVLLDEIGALPGETASKLGHTVRSIFTTRHTKPELARFVFILSGALDMLRLKTGRSSPLWNVTESIYLEALPLDETLRLLATGFAAGGLTDNDALSRQVYAWSGGQPYWTQLLAATLLEQAAPDATQVDAIAATLLQDEDRNLPHLLHLLDERKDMFWPRLAALLEGKDVPFTRSDRVLAELELVGAVVNQGGRCAIANRMYHETLAREAARRHLLPSVAALPGDTHSAEAVATAPGTLHALIIGVAAYQAIPPLAKTSTDAADMHATLLAQGCHPLHARLLLNEQASKAAISAELDALARRATPDDTAIIFFSGHGLRLVGGFWPGEYLCPIEATWRGNPDTLISDVELGAALRAICAGRLVVFLDACHAGGLGALDDATAQVHPGWSEKAYDRLALGQGRVIIASCRPDERAYELQTMRNGLFTHYLLEGLRGAAARNDGSIWMSSLFGYVYQSVVAHQLQRPFQKTAAEDFIIAGVRASEVG